MKKRDIEMNGVSRNNDLIYEVILFKFNLILFLNSFFKFNKIHPVIGVN